MKKDSEILGRAAELAKKHKDHKGELGKLARETLSVHRSLVRSEKIEEDLEIFTGDKDFWKKLARGELTKEEIAAKIKPFKRELREFSNLLREARMRLAEAKRKKN